MPALDLRAARLDLIIVPGADVTLAATFGFDLTGWTAWTARLIRPGGEEVVAVDASQLADRRITLTMPAVQTATFDAPIDWYFKATDESSGIVALWRGTIVADERGGPPSAVGYTLTLNLGTSEVEVVPVGVTAGGTSAPVTSVNTQTGDVVLAAADVGAATTAALAAETAARAAGDALAVPLTQKGAAGGVAELDGTGKVPAVQLPAIAISEHLGTVASQAAMLALTGQRGDWCTRSDLTADFILIADDASILGNWKQLVHPADAVLTVQGRTGVVTLDDLFAAAAHNHDAAAITTGTLADARIPATITRDAEAVAYAIALG